MRSWNRVRGAVAVLGLCVMALFIVGPASAETCPPDLEAAGKCRIGGGAAYPVDTWSGTARGAAVDFSIDLPAAVVSALQSQGQSAPRLHDVISFSDADAEWTASGPVGNAIGSLFDPTGTLGSMAALQRRAEADLGETAAAQILDQSALGGVHVAVGKVNARAARLSGGVKPLLANGTSSIANVSINLGDILDQNATARATVEAAVDKLLAVLYGDPTATVPVLQQGVIPTLQGQIDGALTVLKPVMDVEGKTGLNVELPVITKAMLLDKPMLSIAKIETKSNVTEGTGALAGYKVSTAESVVTDLDILGGLVHIDVLVAKGGVAVNGKPGQAKLLPTTQKVAGVTVGSNHVAIEKLRSVGTLLDDTTINGKTAGQVLHDTAPQVEGTIRGLLNLIVSDIAGISMSTPAVSQGVDEATVPGGIARQRAQQHVTALVINVQPLSQPVLGQDLSAVAALLPTASLKVSSVDVSAGNVPLKVLPFCIGQCSPTGIPQGMYWVVGAMMLGGAFGLKRFALAK